MALLVRLALIALLLVASTAWTPLADGQSRDDISRWIQQLGDNSFSVREEASRKLWQAGRTAEAALALALKSDDPEVARRSRELLDKFKWGIFPDTPAKVVDLINRYLNSQRGDKPGIVKELLGQGNSGCVALTRIAAAEEDADVKRSLIQQITVETARAIPALLADGSLSTLEELLELALTGESDSAVPSYAAYWLMRGRLDERIAHWKPRAEKSGGARAAEVLTYLYRAKGDLAAARQTAAKADRADLIEALLFEERDWKELAKARSAGSGRPTAETLGRRAAFLRMAGDEKTQRDEFEKVIAEIRKSAEKAEDEWEAWPAAKALFLNGRPKDALALLTSERNAATAFDILCAQMRFREALELAAKVSNGIKGPPALEVLHGRTLFLLGEKDKAQAIFTKLAEQIRDDNEAAWQESLVQWEWRIGLKDQALDHCARLLGYAKNVDSPARLLGEIFPGNANSAWAWWQFLRQRPNAEEPALRMRRLRNIMTGKAEVKELTALGKEMEEAAQVLGPGDRDRWLMALGEAFQAAGLDAQARSCFEKAAGVQGSSAALLRLGDFLAEKKLWKLAGEQYAKAWQTDRREPLPLFLRGWVLQQSGDEKEGRKVMDLAHWLPLGDERQRTNFAEELGKRGHVEAARQQRALLLKTCRLGSFYAGETLRQEGMFAYLRKDYLKAADYHELATLRVLGANVSFVESGAYVAMPHFIHRLRATGLAAAGKIDEARREVDLCLEAQPGNVELAILLVPVLEKRGQAKEAEDLLDRYITLYEKMCTDYPQSATLHNSLAWMLACCRKKLDLAMAHANQAVRLAPNQAGYLDTLAEVNFQSGDKDRAIELMKQCVALEPKRDFFRKQLKRFEAGDPKVDVPVTIDDD